MRPIHKSEFRRCEIEPVGPRPDYPWMRGNELIPNPAAEARGDTVEWMFRGIVVYPSGRLKYWHMLLPPSTRDVAVASVRTLDFWKNYWETMIIVMGGEGEGPQGQKVSVH